MMLIDDHSVVCDPITFRRALPHYDISLPTGQEIGKRWFSGFFMGEFLSYTADGQYVVIKWRDVYVVEDKSASDFRNTRAALLEMKHKLLDPFWDGIDRGCCEWMREEAAEFHAELSASLADKERRQREVKRDE